VASVDELFELAAYSLTFNALRYHQQLGRTVVAGRCDSCDDKTGKPVTICVCCAVVTYRGFDGSIDVEDRMASIFGLTYSWVLDFIGGFDGSGKPDHPNAKKFGAKLRRKFVK